MNDEFDDIARRARPDHEPPKLSPILQPLVKAPCRHCGSDRLYGQSARQTGTSNTLWVNPGDPPEGKTVSMLVSLDVLCGGCGLVEERRGWQPLVSDPDHENP